MSVRRLGLVATIARSGVLAASLVLAAPVGAQDPPRRNGQAQGTRLQDDLSGALITLRALQQSIAGRERELRQKQDEVGAEPNEQRKLLLLDEARAIEKDLARMRRDLDAVMTGIELDELDPGEKGFDLEAELKELLRPLIEQVKDLTAEPRQIDHLRTELADAVRRQATAERGLAQIDRLLQQSPADDELRPLLEEGRARWQRRINDIRNLRTVAQHQLETRLAERRSFVESTRAFASEFFRTRGLNLLLSITAFVVVFLSLRLLYRPFGRAASRRRGGVYLRLLAVLFHVAVVVLAVLAALAVLYVAGDWVLLGIALIFLLGLAWAGRTALPRFVEDIRWVLNLGPVRERERVLFQGLPWRVDRLSLYARLVNPALSGGELRLPLRTLSGLHSRACDDKEIWFPTQEGDWVLLDGGLRGRVVLQTPDTVQMVKLGGARVTMPTAAFLDLHPENLSTGFRIRSTFGVDYAHQDIAPSEMPRAMQQRLESGLTALVGDAVVSVKVEFKEAGSSSLDIEALCDFRGTAAPQYEALARAIQRILVEACNERRWVIPFPQLTVHQA